MSRTETDKYIYKLRVMFTREETDESKIKYVRKKSYYWTYPHTPNNKCYDYIYQTIKPMTLEECAKFINEVWDCPRTQDYDNNFDFIYEIVRKEDE